MNDWVGTYPNGEGQQPPSSLKKKVLQKGATLDKMRLEPTFSRKTTSLRGVRNSTCN
jgi:hypothetical protein